MKRNHVAFVGLALAMTVLMGCLGQKARDNVLMPTVGMAWESVKQDVIRGPTPAPTSLETFDAAVRSGDRTTLSGVAAVSWPEIHEVAASNLEAASFSDGVKESKREQLRNFDEAIRKVGERLKTSQ